MADKFCGVDNWGVLIPYKDLEMMLQIAHELEDMRRQYARMEEQYTAIRGMFSECLAKIAEIRDFVGNS